MVEPLKLVPKLTDPDDLKRRSDMLEHLEWYRVEVESGELDQLAIVATYTSGSVSTSAVVKPGKRAAFIGVINVWLHRVTRRYVDDLEE